MEDGVWRTIRGRRVFIKNKQSVKDAIKESGKFEKASDISRNELKNIEAEVDVMNAQKDLLANKDASKADELKQKYDEARKHNEDLKREPIEDNYTNDLEGKHIAKKEPTKEYKSNFLLEAEVNDFDAAQEYLTSDDMAQYLPKELQDVVTSVDWTLDDESSGHVSVKTTRDLTDSEKTQLQGWIDGQNSDGLGEGFEQQKFAETYYNPYTGDGPYTYNEAENEITDMFDRMDPSDYSDYLDETMVEDAIDTYIADAGYDSNDEEARENARADILDNPEEYLDWETIDNAKNDAIQGNDEYNIDSWYNMSSMRRNGDSFEETDLKPAKEEDIKSKLEKDMGEELVEHTNDKGDKWYSSKSLDDEEKQFRNKVEDNIDDYRNMGSEEGIASYMNDKGVSEEEAYKKLYSKEINDYKNSAPDDAVAEMAEDFGISEEKANKILYGDDDYEYNLYKQSKENPDSINPMTEWSTDWEALDEKYKDRYEKEKSSSSNEDNISKELFNEASKIEDPLDRAIQMQVADDVGKTLTDDDIRFRAKNYIKNNYNGNASDDEIYEKLKSAYKNNGSYQETNNDGRSFGDKFMQKAKNLDDRDKGKISEEEYFNRNAEIEGQDPEKEKEKVKGNLDRLGVEKPEYLQERDTGSAYAKPGKKWEVLEKDKSAFGKDIYKVRDEEGNVQWKDASDFETSNNTKANKPDQKILDAVKTSFLYKDEGEMSSGLQKNYDTFGKKDVDNALKYYEDNYELIKGTQSDTEGLTYNEMLAKKDYPADALKQYKNKMEELRNSGLQYDSSREYNTRANELREELEASKNKTEVKDENISNKSDDWVKEAYKKYLKEHPKSKISLSDFMKKNK